MPEPLSPPADCQLRAASFDDLLAVQQLRTACDIADYGEVLLTAEQLHSRWNAPGFALAHDAWVVVAITGQPLAYAEARSSAEVGREVAEVWLAVFVAPDQRGRGIGRWLLQVAEARAAAQAASGGKGKPVALYCRASGRNLSAQRILARAGYTTDLAFRIMAITFAEPPPPPVWPERLAVRPFVVGRDDQTTYAADEEASVDKGYYRPLTFAGWSERMGLGRVDPALWFLAWDGDDVAGVALNYVAPATGLGWVDHLGVRRPWRGKGLGLALLRYSVAAFYERGIREVRLSVDDRSQTNATRLYERAGMITLQHYHIYAKSLRPLSSTEAQVGSAW